MSPEAKPTGDAPPPLAYATPQPIPLLLRPRVRRWLLRSTLVAIVAYVAAAFLTGPSYGGFSICTRCGEMLCVDEYRLPLTRLTIYRRHTRRPTAVSRVVAKPGAAAGHADQPVFVHGGGSSLLWKVRASGRNGLLRIADDGVVATFLDEVLTFADPATGKAWVARVLGMSEAFELLGALLDAEYPTAGFGSDLAFRAWWAIHEPALKKAADAAAAK